jgi:hypothetical protein
LRILGSSDFISPKRVLVSLSGSGLTEQTTTIWPNILYCTNVEIRGGKNDDVWWLSSATDHVISPNIIFNHFQWDYFHIPKKTQPDIKPLLLGWGGLRWTLTSNDFVYYLQSGESSQNTKTIIIIIQIQDQSNFVHTFG